MKDHLFYLHFCVSSLGNKSKSKISAFPSSFGIFINLPIDKFCHSVCQVELFEDVFLSISSFPSFSSLQIFITFVPFRAFITVSISANKSTSFLCLCLPPMRPLLFAILSFHFVLSLGTFIQRNHDICKNLSPQKCAS